MRVFCLSDTHGTVPHLPERMDLAVLIGDFSDAGRLAQRLFAALAKRGVPVYFVSGEHESPELCAALAKKYGATWLDYSWALAGELFLAGVGGNDLSESGWPGRLDAFCANLSGLQIQPMPKFFLLLSYIPPYPWRYNQKLRGNRLVQNVTNITPYAWKHSYKLYGNRRLRNLSFAWRFNLAAIGHYHEDEAKLETEDVLCPTLNPSFDGCVIEIGAAGEFKLFRNPGEESGEEGENAPFGPI